MRNSDVPHNSNKIALWSHRGTYEFLRPLIIWLGLLQLAWISYWLLSGDIFSDTYQNTIVVWIISMLLWLGAAIYLSRRGYFLKFTRIFSNLLGLAFVVFATVLLFSVMPQVWQNLAAVTMNISDDEFISIHVLRLLAVGTIIKYVQKELPRHFLLMGSIPDFIFAVSAVFLLAATDLELIESSYLAIWHVIGIAVFFGAGHSMFMSVPSPVQIFRTQPDTSIVFKFPMVLAPIFTVPLFMLAHLLALVKYFTLHP